MRFLHKQPPLSFKLLDDRKCTIIFTRISYVQTTKYTTSMEGLNLEIEFSLLFKSKLRHITMENVFHHSRKYPRIIYNMKDRIDPWNEGNVTENQRVVHNLT